MIDNILKPLIQRNDLSVPYPFVRIIDNFPGGERALHICIRSMVAQKDMIANDLSHFRIAVVNTDDLALLSMLTNSVFAETLTCRVL